MIFTSIAIFLGFVRAFVREREQKTVKLSIFRNLAARADAHASVSMCERRSRCRWNYLGDPRACVLRKRCRKKKMVCGALALALLKVGVDSLWLDSEARFARSNGRTAIWNRTGPGLHTLQSVVVTLTLASDENYLLSFTLNLTRSRFIAAPPSQLTSSADSA